MISNLRYSIASLLLAVVFSGNLSYGQLPTIPPCHILVVIEENLTYSQIIGPSAICPYINDLAASPYSAVFTQSYALTHPSQPNYLDLYAGNDQGTNGTDNIPTNTPYTTDNLGAELLAKGKTFITYSEGLPSVGYLGANIGLYWRKHNPVAYWQVASGTPGTNQYGASLNQPYTAFPSDSAYYDTLPTILFVIPNSVNDMHDGTYPSCATAGDTWFHNNLSNYMAWALNHNSMMILTMDEDDGSNPNIIPTIFYGPMIKSGSYPQTGNLPQQITHFSVLRTLEDLYGLGHAGAAADSSAITYCWSSVNPSATTNCQPSRVGVNNTVAISNAFQVNPNPAYDEITFNCTIAMTTDATITVTDAVGRIAGKYTMKGTSLEVNTSSYAPGFYVYKVINTASNLAGEGKFIIAHN